MTTMTKAVGQPARHASGEPGEEMAHDHADEDRGERDPGELEDHRRDRQGRHAPAARGQEPRHRPAQHERDGEHGDEARQGGEHDGERDIAAADEGHRVGGGAGRAERDDEQPERQLGRQAKEDADGETEQRQDEEMGGEAGADQHRIAGDQSEIPERQGEAEAEHDQHQPDRDHRRVDELDPILAHSPHTRRAKPTKLRPMIFSIRRAGQRRASRRAISRRYWFGRLIRLGELLYQERTCVGTVGYGCLPVFDHPVGIMPAP